MFLTTFTCVGIMLLAAIPGYLTIKTKIIKSNAIPGFATFLMYVCQPCITLYTFQQVDFSWQILAHMGIVFLLSFGIMIILLLGYYAIFRRKYDNISYRIGNIAVCFGNFAFLGIPLLQAVLPGNYEAIMFTSSFFTSMNILGWTVGSTLITQDKKYMKPKKIILNPAIISLVIAVLLYIFDIRFPSQLLDMVTIMGKMSTPLCMTILGMRLATVKIKEVFTDKLSYFACFIKQIIMPLLALIAVIFLPVSHDFKVAFFVISSCPVASVVLNFAEMLGNGQKNAANTVLLSTMTSIITIPLMLLLINLIP